MSWGDLSVSHHLGLCLARGRHLSGERKKINKKCNHNVGKQYKIIEGEWYYGKEKGETEQSKEAGNAWMKTLL